MIPPFFFMEAPVSGSAHIRDRQHTRNLPAYSRPQRIDGSKPRNTPLVQKSSENLFRASSMASIRQIRSPPPFSS
jgi:hypothetical protein